MPYYFLKDDFSVLNNEIERLTQGLKRMSLEGGRDCQEDRGIFTFEEVERQKNLLSTRLRELIMIRNNAEVPILNERPDRVSLGSRVSFRDNLTGEVQTYAIGSYMLFSKSKKENTISYASPFACLLMGAQVDEVRIGMISGKEKSFQIMKIEY